MAHYEIDEVKWRVAEMLMLGPAPLRTPCGALFVSRDDMPDAGVHTERSLAVPPSKRVQLAVVEPGIATREHLDDLVAVDAVGTLVVEEAFGLVRLKAQFFADLSARRRQGCFSAVDAAAGQ